MKRPRRYEYGLTDEGRALWPVLLELTHWGDRHAAGGDRPGVVYRHRDGDGVVGSGRRCAACGTFVERREIVLEAGPGAPRDHPIRAHLAASA